MTLRSRSRKLKNMDDRERQDRDGAISRTARLAEMIAGDFYDDRFDLSARDEAQGGAWSRLPEVLTVKRVQGLDPAGASGRRVRLFLTFLAAMDRARDAMRLWMAGADLFESHPDLFEPARVQDVPVPTLRNLLSRFKVSQRHSIDSRAWSVIARTLASEECPVKTAIENGVGDAQGLLEDLRRKRHAERPRFPMLRGPKVGPMWVRMMAAPGAANIAGLETLPVAVDTHVKKVTEILGVVDSRGLSVDEARPSIESAWREGVAATKLGGPAGIADTCAALDPALWFFGKHGCSHCQKIGAFAPIGRACGHCQLFEEAAVGRRSQRRTASGRGR